MSVLLLLLFSGACYARESVHSTILRMELMQQIAGIPIEAQTRRVSRWIEDRHSVRARCAQGFFSGLSDLRCVMGLRTLANALNLGKIPRLPEFLAVEIGDEWRGLVINARVAKVTIPYRAAEWAVTFFISSELTSPEYAKRIQLLHQMEDLREEIESLSGKEVEIDEALNNTDALSGLYGLKLYLKSTGQPLNGPSEVIVISNGFRLPYEDGMKLKEDISSRAHIRKLDAYFANPSRLGYGTPGSWPYTFFRERDLLAPAIEELKKVLKAEEVICSPAGLTLRDCRLSMQRLTNVLRLPTLRLPKIERIIFTTPEEMPVAADSFLDSKSNKTVLLVRSDFGLAPLLRIFNLLGWETLPGDEK